MPDPLRPCKHCQSPAVTRETPTGYAVVECPNFGTQSASCAQPPSISCRSADEAAQTWNVLNHPACAA